MMKNIFKILCILVLTNNFVSTAYALINPEHSNNNLKTWAFFDLGNTIISVNSKKQIKYMPRALSYLHSLKERGLNIGVISNIPESFGDTYEKKLATLKKYITKRWIDKIPFDWSIFNKIILPLNDSERKPAPILFERALELGKSCPIVFMSENTQEVLSAKELGFLSFQVGTTEDSDFYINEEVLILKLQQMIKSKSNKFLPECMYAR